MILMQMCQFDLDKRFQKVVSNLEKQIMEKDQQNAEIENQIVWLVENLQQSKKEV